MELSRETVLALLTGIQKVIKERRGSTLSLLNILQAYFKMRPRIIEFYPEVMSVFPESILPPKAVSRNSISSYEYSQGMRELTFVSDEILGMYESEIDALVETLISLNIKNGVLTPKTSRIFISHGRKEEWRKIQEYVEKTLDIPTLELAQSPNKGRTIFQKLIDESDECTFAVIVMTGDDLTTDEEIRARENVIHEIGYFQGKYGANRVCLLHENGVNIPTNIQGLVYIPFPRDGVEAALGGLTRELKHL